MGPNGYGCWCRFLRKGARIWCRPQYVLLLVLLLYAISGRAAAHAQDEEVPPQASGAAIFTQLPHGPDAVEGTVINRVTREPIARALVYTPDNRYATFTDDRGHFELKFPEQEKTPPPAATPGDAESLRRMQAWYMRNARPDNFFARKPGYLPDFTGTPLPETQEGGRAKIVLTLEPEALIVGHLQFPGNDSTERIDLELYRQDFEDGRERWTQASYFRTWATGEFRFYDLSAGTYKLVTMEQLERDPARFNPQDQLYGYPPVFYPNVSDLASAAPIRVAAGAKVDVNITVTRRPYYPVKIPVANAPAAGGLNVLVFPRNHPGPGYSLRYDPGEQAIQGNLPDGDYTLKVSHSSEAGMSGLLNFSVRGGPVETPPLTLVPNWSLTVNITRELSGAPSPQEESSNEVTVGDDSRPIVNVSLSSAELFDGQNGSTKPSQATGKQDSLALKNVSSGRYWLTVSTYNCYVARATWGGKDVLRQPMDLSTDTVELPIEMVLRNDGATVSGSVADSQSSNLSEQDRRAGAGQPAFIYFLPLDDSNGQFHETPTTQDGTFEEAQIPPGTYRILAFAQEKGEIGRANPEVRKQYDGKGVVVELAPNQTLHLLSPLTVSQP